MALTQISTNGVKDGSLKNADVASDAAIALSKLATGALPSGLTVASANITDGTILNADINSSAAIAGTKISPAFGSQTVSASNLTLTDPDPAINFVDSGDNPDYQIVVNAGHFQIKDSTSSADRLYINASSTTITNNLNANSGVDVTGDITVTGTVDGVDIAALNSTVSGITTNATHSGEVTGSTALTIADNVVDEANLKVSNSPTNGQFLSAQSGNTGGLTWATVSSGAALTGSTDNTICTVTGANAIQGEANLEFNGNRLTVITSEIVLGQTLPDKGIVVQASSNMTTGKALPLLSASPVAGSGIGRARAGIAAISDSTHGTAGMDLAFMTRYAADGTDLDVTADERLRITSDGKVGIGMASPHVELDIFGDASSRIVLRTVDGSSTSNHANLSFCVGSGSAPASGNTLGVIESNVTATGGSCTGDLRFYTNPGDSLTERLRIDSSGRLLINNTTSSTMWGYGQAGLQVTGNYDEASASFINDENNTNSHAITLGKIRGSSIVQSGDFCGSIAWNVYDGSAYKPTARIHAAVDGTPGSGDMPGRLVFETTADGGSTPTERLRITSDGKFGFNTTDTSGNQRVTIKQTSHDTPLFLLSDQSNCYMGLGNSAATNGYIGFENTTLTFHTAGKKASINNQGELRLHQNNLRIPGEGISWEEIGSSATAKVLDDYEIGTWTPQIRCSSGTGVAGSNNAGYYIKIGKMVFAHGTCHWTSLSGTTSTYVQLIGLPYTTKNSTNYRFSGGIQGGQITGVHHGDAYWFIYYGADANNNFVYITSVDLADESGANYTHTPTVESTGTLYSISFNYQTD